MAPLTLAQAVALARKHHHSPADLLTVRDAVKKLVAEKEAENLRERSVRHLKDRLSSHLEIISRTRLFVLVICDFWPTLDPLSRQSQAFPAHTDERFFLSRNHFPPRFPRYSLL
ncbi:MAG: hypothetical protein EXS41_10520 [Opitutaceae bacterium]|nr:hypothetical protein [Opitutaceae bacterium]